MVGSMVEVAKVVMMEVGRARRLAGRLAGPARTRDAKDPSRSILPSCRALSHRRTLQTPYPGIQVQWRDWLVVVAGVMVMAVVLVAVRVNTVRNGTTRRNKLTAHMCMTARSR